MYIPTFLPSTLVHLHVDQRGAWQPSERVHSSMTNISKDSSEFPNKAQPEDTPFLTTAAGITQLKRL